MRHSRSSPPRRPDPSAIQLEPLDSSERLQLVADWLARKDNYQWLDFGDGKQILTLAWLKILTQQDTQVLRVYTAGGGKPLGIVGLDAVNRHFGTARIWLAAGEKSFAARGHATHAASKMLTYAFQELGLQAVYTWVVEHNTSLRIAERLGFRFVGRQRECHVIEGRAYDRLWFDILASEHRESETIRGPHRQTQEPSAVD